MVLKSFCGPSYLSQSPNAAADRLINLICEKDELGTGKNSYFLYPTPGILDNVLPSTFASQYGVRGLWAANPTPHLKTLAGWKGPGLGLFVARAGKFSEICIDNSGLPPGPTYLQDLATYTTKATEPVVMRDNGYTGQVLVCANGRLDLWDPNTSTYTSDVFAVGATGAYFTAIEYMDGYFLALDSNHGALYCSGLNDGLTWNHAAKTMRLSAPDPWIGMIRAHKELWLYGSQTTDVYYDDANSVLMPFGPVPNAFIEQGIGGYFCVSNADMTPIWLARNRSGKYLVLRAQGLGNPARISTHAIEYALSQDTGLIGAQTNATAFTVLEQGHVIWVLQTGTRTWCYDCATGFWSERMDGGDQNGAVGNPWRVGCACYGQTYFGATFRDGCIVGDTYAVPSTYLTNVYELTPASSVTFGGGAIYRVRQAPHLCQEQGYVFHHLFQLDMENGLGAATSGYNLNLQWSDDGGHTWSTSITLAQGALDAYATRMIWRRLGRSRDRVYRVWTTANAPNRWINAYLDIEQGTS